METLVRVTHIDTHLGERRKRMRFVFELTASEQSAYLRDIKGTLREMQYEGFIAPFGCDCGCCRNDGDCCGRFMLSSMKSVLAGSRLIVLQQFYRNI